MAALVYWPFCKALPSRARADFTGSSVTDMGSKIKRTIVLFCSILGARGLGQRP